MKQATLEELDSTIWNLSIEERNLASRVKATIS
jgi:hypothetical protein